MRGDVREPDPTNEASYPVTLDATLEDRAYTAPKGERIANMPSGIRLPIVRVRN
jgi:hypothetical protein